MHIPSFQRIAIIDLGSNTARLVVLQASPGYAYRLEDEIREVVRLRQGMTEDGLSAEAIERGFFALRLFKRFCDAVRTDVIIATATSAVRDAANGRQFVERVEHEIGLKLVILDGEREAYYGAIGALNDVATRDGHVLDIGGGSAQISAVEGGHYLRGQSAPLGSLALTERFVQSDPAEKREIAALQREIERHLERFDWLESGRGALIGVGGTIRNLAQMSAERQGYPLRTLHGYVLSADSLTESIDLLRSLPLAKRRKLPGLRSDRADIILAGAIALAAVMRRLRSDEILVSLHGLREGLFFERFWSHLAYPVVPDVRGFGVLNLARIYRYQKGHVNHVRFLARRLFDQLTPLHGYGVAERELLDAAAVLHDLGTLIGYEAHDRHSQMLIVNNGLPGFTPREIALIALLVRYHRKGTPETADFAPLLASDDETRLLCLAAVLRLAEYLERGRTSAVDDVVVTWTANHLRITLVADAYPAVELWQAERNAAELIASCFGRTTLLDSTAAPAIAGGSRCEP